MKAVISYYKREELAVAYVYVEHPKLSIWTPFLLPSGYPAGKPKTQFFLERLSFGKPDGILVSLILKGKSKKEVGTKLDISNRGKTHKNVLHGTHKDQHLGERIREKKIYVIFQSGIFRLVGYPANWESTNIHIPTCSQACIRTVSKYSNTEERVQTVHTCTVLA